MSINHWTPESGSLLQRVDINMGKKWGNQRNNKAIIYPPEGATDPTLTELPDYLRQQGYAVTHTCLQETTHILRIGGFGADKTAEALAEDYGLQSFHTKLKDGVLEVSGFPSYNWIDIVQQHMKKQGHTVEHVTEPKPPTPVLQVSGFNNEKSFLNDLQHGGFVNGTPKDPYADLPPFKRFTARLNKLFVPLSGVAYLLGDSMSFISGWMRKLYGEAFMGTAFALGSFLLLRPKRQTRMEEELIANAMDDFTVGDTVDFAKDGNFSTGKNAWGVSPEADAFLNKHATDIMVGLQPVAGAGALFGGIKEPKESLALNSAGDQVALKDGRSVLEKTTDWPVLFSGLLLTFGWLPAMFMPKKGSDSHSIWEPGYRFMDKAISLLPDRIENWIRENPRKLAGRASFTHNVQQVIFAIMENFDNKKKLEGLGGRIDREQNILTSLHEGNNAEKVEADFPGHTKEIEILEKWITPVDRNFAYPLASEHNYKEIIADLERIPQLFKIENTEHEHGPATEKEKQVVRDFFEKHNFKLKIESSHLAFAYTELRQLYINALSKELLNTTNQKISISIFDKIERLEPIATDKNINTITLITKSFNNLKNLATYRAILDPEEKVSYPSIEEGDKQKYKYYDRFIQEYESEAWKAGDAMDEDMQLLYQKALSRREYDRIDESKLYFWFRLIGNAFFMTANLLFSEGADEQTSHNKNTAEDAFDFPRLCELAGNELKNNGHENNQYAIDNFAAQLAAQPELQTRRISADKIAEGIRTKLGGGLLEEEHIALHKSPFTTRPQHQTQPSQQTESTPTLDQQPEQKPSIIQRLGLKKQSRNNDDLRDKPAPEQAASMMDHAMKPAAAPAGMGME